ncbi:hypothetical protein TWF102_004626 [Orbilia oligospora]|uniref:Uncharacterized protein n=1 Tax=Orbilia oligospora TaxID=2813651 RepID=A0A7C8N5D4_ORBOL|nr:hypothetical protein TWF102_004626 [Orbilia oligospora]KAF3090663.1 hypothetical protein TWF706_009800 [Orbilia oligospora]KAF3091862.1 hypothetical protein TWF103_011424 [Orbilia oligospora]
MTATTLDTHELGDTYTIALYNGFEPKGHRIFETLELLAGKLIVVEWDQESPKASIECFKTQQGSRLFMVISESKDIHFNEIKGMCNIFGSLPRVDSDPTLRVLPKNIEGLKTLARQCRTSGWDIILDSKGNPVFTAI